MADRFGRPWAALAGAALLVAVAVAAGAAWNARTPTWSPAPVRRAAPALRLDGVVALWSLPDGGLLRLDADSLRPGQRRIGATPIRLAIDDRATLVAPRAVIAHGGATSAFAAASGWIDGRRLALATADGERVIDLRTGAIE